MTQPECLYVGTSDRPALRRCGGRAPPDMGNLKSKKQRDHYPLLSIRKGEVLADMVVAVMGKGRN